MHYFIEKMMSKERDFRYQTAREVVDDITEVLEGAADLQYNPAEDANSPFQFNLGGGDPHSSQRITKVGNATGKFQPISGQSSGRMKPDGSSVRLPGQSTRGGSNSTSIRRPVTPGGNNTSSVRKPLNKPGTSVRLPGKSKKLPPAKKPGDSQRG
jgi:hypothetical protein